MDDYSACDDEGGVEGIDIVVVRTDTADGGVQARRVGEKCQRRGARSVRFWTIPEYGTRFPTMKEWMQHRDLVALLARERADGWRGFAGFAGMSHREAPVFSREPRPIATSLLPVPRLQPTMIPGPFRAWCVDIAERVGCPLEYVAAPLIVVLSGVVGRRIAIRPQRHDDWKVIPNLWGAVVGPPGSLKTPAIEEICRPLKKLAGDAMGRHGAALDDHHEEALIATAKRTAARKAMDQAARKGEGDDRLKDLARQIAEGRDSDPPDLKRYFVNDVTNEKLGELMAQEVNADGLIVFRDELVGFFKTLDRSGHEADRSFYLEAWNGSGSFTFDRIGRGTIHIPHACLSLFGGIQPGPLASYLKGSFSGEKSDGFMQRFQVMMFPDRPRKFLNVDRSPDAAARERAEAIFRALDALDPLAKGCRVEDESGIPHLRFADDAQEFFHAWRLALEDWLCSEVLSAVMNHHLSKYRSLMPSLALIFHLVDAYDRPALEPVSLDAAVAAAAWCEHLEAHAARIYHAAMEGDPDDAIRLGERLAARLSNPFTCRDVAKKGWAGLGTSEDVRRAVGILEDRNWVQVVEVPSTERGGRPTELVWIHPRLLGRPGPQR
jgi:putative DNA primase/helicase